MSILIWYSHPAAARSTLSGYGSWAGFTTGKHRIRRRRHNLRELQHVRQPIVVFAHESEKYGIRNSLARTGSY
jgi:hypothetical protein